MHLRTRIFLLFGALLALVLCAQWWLSDSLTREMERETAKIANKAVEDTTEALRKYVDLAKELVAEEDEHPALPMLPMNASYPGIRQKGEDFFTTLTLGSISIFVLGLIVAGFVAHRVTVPLRNLAQAAVEVGQGKLGTHVPQVMDPEMNATIAAFNQMSTQLAKLREQAEKMQEQQHLTELGEVARGMAHSLRNPLNVLGLEMDEVLQEGSTEEQRQGRITNIRSQIQRIDRTLRSFLAWSVEGVGGVQEVDVAEVAEDVALEVLQDPQLQVKLQVSAESCKIPALAAELRSAIHSLVVNAVEASPAGSTVHLLVSPQTDDGVMVQVIDEGSGLDPVIREQLFTPHSTTKKRGAGMGLFLTSRLVKSRYGGDLRLQPNTPKGTQAIMQLHPRGEDLHG